MFSIELILFIKITEDMYLK